MTIIERATHWMRDVGGRWGFVLVALFGVVVGGVAGWIAGSWTACSPSPGCEFRVQSAEALGTWVGGLGGIAAVLFAVVTFRREEQSRRDAESAARRSRREREATEEADAALVTTRAWIGASSGDHVMYIRLMVNNRANTAPIYKVVGSLGRFGERPEIPTIGPLKSDGWQVNFRPRYKGEEALDV